MLNIGFFELLLISVVALLVLGPEKLPGAIRTTALYVGRARRSFNKVRQEIEQEINADDIRRQLHNESILADLKETRDKTKSLIDESTKNARKISDDLSNSMNELASRKVPLLDEETADQEPVGKIQQVETIKPAAESSEEDAEVLPSIAPPETEKAEAKAPVQDFYNNPGSGTVELRGDKPRPAEPEPQSEPEPDAEKNSADPGQSDQDKQKQ